MIAIFIISDYNFIEAQAKFKALISKKIGYWNGPSIDLMSYKKHMSLAAALALLKKAVQSV